MSELTELQSKLKRVLEAETVVCSECVNDDEDEEEPIGMGYVTSGNYGDGTLEIYGCTYCGGSGGGLEDKEKAKFTHTDRNGKKYPGIRSWSERMELVGAKYGTGRFPDPKYAPLLEVIREKCEMMKYCALDSDAPKETDISILKWACSEHGFPCNGSGYVLRSVWAELREAGIKGALAGALLQATAETSPKLATKGLPEIRINWGYRGKDPDLAALQAVLEAMISSHLLGDK